jgi:excisionase family DNA binding protein
LTILRCLTRLFPVATLIMTARHFTRRSDCTAAGPPRGRLTQDNDCFDMIAARRSRNPHQPVDPPQLTQSGVVVEPPALVWLTVTQVAQRLQVSSDTVRGWVASGELPATDVTAAGPRQRRHVRITEAHLRDFLERRQFQPLRPATAPARTNRLATNGRGQPPIQDYFPDAPPSPALN